jgi:hypothetical protein
MLKAHRKNALIFATLLATIIIISVGFFLRKEAPIAELPHRTQKEVMKPDFSTATPFLSLMEQSKCSSENLSVSDQYRCIAAITKNTLNEIDVLADKLISTSLKRSLETKTAKNSPMPWEFGGKDFLDELPVNVKSAQSARDAYLDSICVLDAMKIYGGSGTDLEVESCKYYYAQQYLKIIKSLESWLTTVIQ